MTGPARSFSGLGYDAPFEIDMEEEVRLSYESVKNVDVLDVSDGEPCCPGLVKDALTYSRGIPNLVHGRVGL